MSASINDLQTRAWKRFHGTATGTALITAPIRIMAFHLGAGSATSSAIVDNAATAVGTDIFKATALAAGNSTYLTFGPAGTVYDVGVSVTLAGTGATFDIFYLTD